MASIEQDLSLLRIAVEEIQDYLVSGEVYWSLSGPRTRGLAPNSRMTLGSLLLAGRRLKGWPLSPKQQSEASELQNRLDTARDQWRGHWEKKAQQEFPVRLTLWSNYLTDIRQDPASAQKTYAYEVQRRAMLELLQGEAAIDPRELDRLRDRDMQLEHIFKPGVFAWDAALAQVFPGKPFWYLYGSV